MSECCDWKRENKRKEREREGGKWVHSCCWQAAMSLPVGVCIRARACVSPSVWGPIVSLSFSYRYPAFSFSFHRNTFPVFCCSYSLFSLFLLSCYPSHSLPLSLSLSFCCCSCCSQSWWCQRTVVSLFPDFHSSYCASRSAKPDTCAIHTQCLSFLFLFCSHATQWLPADEVNVSTVGLLVKFSGLIHVSLVCGSFQQAHD